MSRTVRAVVTRDGEYLGTTDPVEVADPWWADVTPVVAALRDRLGAVHVLRLLAVRGGEGGRDGNVTYHVEALDRPDHLALAPADLAPHPLRMPWATASGLRDLLDWAAEAAGPLTGPPEQVRTWNLACLFRLPTAAGPVWLKAVPPFAADEGAVLTAYAQVDPSLVPRPLATGDHRVLLAHVPGAECWRAEPDVLADGVRRFVAAQAVVGPLPGLPDRRPKRMVVEVEALLDRLGDELTADEHRRTRELAAAYPALDGCGLPDVTAHGDFHPGNWRSDGGSPVIFDVADACVANPALDIQRLCEFLPASQRAGARAVWVDAWRSVAPGSDPVRAAELAEPLSHLHFAVRYQEFLDGIEPSERVYHEGDPVTEIRAALRS